MSDSSARNLLDQALHLPASERLGLANELLNSVEGPEAAAWSEAWLSELDRRMQEAERDGDDEDWGELRARLSAELRAR